MKKSIKTIILLCIVCFIASCLILIGIKGENQTKEEDTAGANLEETLGDPDSFQGPEELVLLDEEISLVPEAYLEAKNRNSDVYAWIDIPDTNVHYPILQGGPDDSYYLNHTIDKEAGYPGSIYTESVNRKDFSDYNTVVYGHNMKDGSMFKHLHKFEDPEFFDQHPCVTVYTNDKMFVYQVYAAVVYGNRHIMKSFDFDVEEERLAFINSLNTGESVNHFRENVTVDENSKLLTLATCIGGRPDHRYLVVCKLVE